jgi:farnesyl-diphosphate farnesyltransferase
VTTLYVRDTEPGLSPASGDDIDYQQRILQGVSRTFALTIPQLPGGLRTAVGNAYLLCRIADTIEDDPDMSRERKRYFAARFTEVVEGRSSAAQFAKELTEELAVGIPEAERDLVRRTDAVIRVTESLSEVSQKAMQRCVRIMSEGMAHFQQSASLRGLRSIDELDEYCYVVAGVVGEMLTELFCDHEPSLCARRETLMRLSVSFGQGLQMTNILKDIWADHARGACWLPRDLYAEHGIELEQLSAFRDSAAHANVMAYLVAVARTHLDNALIYTLAIPPGQRGMRRFCLWALGMAVLTLRKIHARPDYSDGREVKISRNAVRGTVAITSLLVGSDSALRSVYTRSTRALPDAIPEFRIHT